MTYIYRLNTIYQMNYALNIYFVFQLCGLLILGFGVALKLNITEFTDVLDEKMNLMPIWCIIIGSIIFVIAFFGCCGAVRESHCMVVTVSYFFN